MLHLTMNANCVSYVPPEFHVVHHSADSFSAADIDVAMASIPGVMMWDGGCCIQPHKLLGDSLSPACLHAAAVIGLGSSA